MENLTINGTAIKILLKSLDCENQAKLPRKEQALFISIPLIGSYKIVKIGKDKYQQTWQG